MRGWREGAESAHIACRKNLNLNRARWRMHAPCALFPCLAPIAGAAMRAIARTSSDTRRESKQARIWSRGWGVVFDRCRLKSGEARFKNDSNFKRLNGLLQRHNEFFETPGFLRLAPGLQTRFHTFQPVRRLVSRPAADRLTDYSSAGKLCCNAAMYQNQTSWMRYDTYRGPTGLYEKSSPWNSS